MARTVRDIDHTILQTMANPAFWQDMVTNTSHGFMGLGFLLSSLSPDEWHHYNVTGDLPGTWDPMNDYVLTWYVHVTRLRAN